MLMMLAPLVGEKLAKPAFFVLMALLLVGGGVALAKCTGGNDDVAEQAKQTTRSSEAIADAAANAIDVIEDQTITEAAIDDAVDDAIKEIEGAQSPDAVRDIVIASLCNQPAHLNDPACAVR